MVLEGGGGRIKSVRKEGEIYREIGGGLREREEVE